MIKTKQEIESLIALYLKGEAAPEQAIAINTWRKLNIQNELQFQEMEKTYAITHNTTTFQASKIDESWKKVERKLSNDVKVIPIWSNKSFLRYAAAILAIASISTVMFWKTNGSISNEIVSLPNDTTQVLEEIKGSTILASNAFKSFTLQDQSKVELTPGSELTIAPDFNTNGRNLKMKGSGTFEVIHDENNPFVIEIENLKVIDVGTVFSLETNLDTVKIMVAEGAVELRINDKVLDVTAGDSAFYLISKQVVARYKQAESREKKVFKFDETPLSDVVKILGEFYGRDIVVMDKEIANCAVSVTFKDEELATILDIIKELLNIKIVQNKDIIGIYGKVCL